MGEGGSFRALRGGAPLPGATFFAGLARQKKQLWSAPPLGALFFGTSWGGGPPLGPSISVALSHVTKPPHVALPASADLVTDAWRL